MEVMFKALKSHAKKKAAARCWNSAPATGGSGAF